MNRSNLIARLDRWAQSVRSAGWAPHYEVPPGAPGAALDAAEDAIGSEFSSSHRSSLLSWDGFEIYVTERRNPIYGLGNDPYRTYSFKLAGVEEVVALTARFRTFAGHAGMGRDGYAQLSRYAPTAVVIWSDGSYAAVINRVPSAGPEFPVRVVDLESPDDDSKAFEVIADSFDDYLEQTLEYLVERRKHAMYWT